MQASRNNYFQIVVSFKQLLIEYKNTSMRSILLSSFKLLMTFTCCASNLRYLFKVFGFLKREQIKMTLSTTYNRVKSLTSPSLLLKGGTVIKTVDICIVVDKRYDRFSIPLFLSKKAYKITANDTF
jgi:hypothetical protein